MLQELFLHHGARQRSLHLRELTLELLLARRTPAPRTKGLLERVEPLRSPRLIVSCDTAYFCDSCSIEAFPDSSAFIASYRSAALRRPGRPRVGSDFSSFVFLMLPLFYPLPGGISRRPKCQPREREQSRTPPFECLKRVRVKVHRSWFAEHWPTLTVPGYLRDAKGGVADGIGIVSVVDDVVLLLEGKQAAGSNRAPALVAC